MSLRLTGEGVGLLARNLARLVRVVAIEQQVLALLRDRPQSSRDLARHVGVPVSRVSRYLINAKRRGQVTVYQPRHLGATWALPGTPPLPRAARPRVLRDAAIPPKHVPTAAESWWITASRQDFAAHARRRLEN